ncbi:MAG: hypothetical protein QN204_01420 [Armatimonadota bacterium]|nr:hypothetical protein [Armatimonadota bacterium]
MSNKSPLVYLPLLTAQEVARMLGWSAWKTWRALREGCVPGVVRIGRRLYVKSAVLRSWLSEARTDEVEQ